MVKNAIKVYARLKPEKQRKRNANYQIYRRPKENIEEDYLVMVSSHRPLEYIDNRPEAWNFAFYHIFEEHAKQDEIFNSVARPVIESVLDGYNGTIFAYGQTGSGKTYSITGDHRTQDSWGIIPRSLEHLFGVVRKHPENVYSVEVAYLEIYNENGYDLLDRSKRSAQCTQLGELPRVTVQEDEAGKLHLKNLTFHQVESKEDALEVLQVGDANRAVADTPMNPQSSRSHCVFTIVVSVKELGQNRYKRAKMHLVDLAGSERVYKCSITGTILTEAKHINLSLHYLEQVIVCLGQESTGHIPYRNSMLTAILRDSLGGNCLTTMLATLSTCSRNIEETISTCRFAQRVALIKNDLNAVLEESIETENTLLRMENERLKRQNEQLKAICNMSSSVEVSEELSLEEKKVLNFQLEKFFRTKASVRWDYDPRKVQYCFERLRNDFVLGEGKNESVNMEYMKNMLMQKDKEISSLKEKLKKERVKGSIQKDGRGEVISEVSTADDLPIELLWRNNKIARKKPLEENSSTNEGKAESKRTSVMDNAKHWYSKLNAKETKSIPSCDSVMPSAYTVLTINSLESLENNTSKEKTMVESEKKNENGRASVPKSNKVKRDGSSGKLVIKKLDTIETPQKISANLQKENIATFPEDNSPLPRSNDEENGKSRYISENSILSKWKNREVPPNETRYGKELEMEDKGLGKCARLKEIDNERTTPRYKEKAIVDDEKKFREKKNTPQKQELSANQGRQQCKLLSMPEEPSEISYTKVMEIDDRSSRKSRLKEAEVSQAPREKVNFIDDESSEAQHNPAQNSDAILSEWPSHTYRMVFDDPSVDEGYPVEVKELEAAESSRKLQMDQWRNCTRQLQLGLLNKDERKSSSVQTERTIVESARSNPTSNSGACTRQRTNRRIFPGEAEFNLASFIKGTEPDKRKNVKNLRDDFTVGPKVRSPPASKGKEEIGLERSRSKWNEGRSPKKDAWLVNGESRNNLIGDGIFSSENSRLDGPAGAEKFFRGNFARERERYHVRRNDSGKVDEDFTKSLPLTGDPEIDEEIIAFYKAKRSGGKY